MISPSQSQTVAESDTVLGLEASARDLVINTTRANRAVGTVALYTPKQTEFSEWCMDGSQGQYRDDIVNESKMRRFLVETQVITDSDGNVLGARLAKPRGRKRRIVDGAVEQAAVDEAFEPYGEDEEAGELTLGHEAFETEFGKG
jgi:hypothetical protein